jgi:Flp pilus assembly protein TadG
MRDRRSSERPTSRAASWRRFRRSEDGNVTVFMGLAGLALLLASGSAIDYARMLSTRTALAAATDAAALQLGNSGLTARADLEQLAEDVVKRNFSQAEHGELTSLELATTAFTVELRVTARFETSFMRLAGIDSIQLPVFSQVTKSGNNLEVSLVLDTTGSMRGSKLRALKSAAKDFVDAVVWDDQGEFYSKVAVVPYSMGVNLGDLAVDARGSVTTGTCAESGCGNFQFSNARGNRRTLAISNCVSERIGAEAFTDLSPTAAPVGRNYASANNPCLDTELLPLSTDKDSIKDRIDDLTATGSTAGQIGIAWGWYALSQDFGLWEDESEPAAYDTEDVSKIAVIMTDGEFNTSYCNGVIAKNSGNGSGAADDKINCNATNGNSATQALELCSAMKQKGVTVYTIGFDIEDEEATQTLMTDCATSPGHAFIAATNSELAEAFAEIGRRVTSLRISM